MPSYKVEKTEDTVSIQLHSYDADYKSLEDFVTEKDIEGKKIVLDITHIELSSPIINTIYHLISYNPARKLNVRIIDDSKEDRLKNLDSYLEKSRVKNYANITYPKELIKK